MDFCHFCIVLSWDGTSDYVCSTSRRLSKKKQVRQFIGVLWPKYGYNLNCLHTFLFQSLFYTFTTRHRLQAYGCCRYPEGTHFWNPGGTNNLYRGFKYFYELYHTNSMIYLHKEHECLILDHSSFQSVIIVVSHTKHGNFAVMHVFWICPLHFSQRTNYTYWDFSLFFQSL